MRGRRATRRQEHEPAHISRPETREPKHLLQETQRGVATEEARIIGAEVPSPEQERRGQVFLIGYVTLLHWRWWPSSPSR